MSLVMMKTSQLSAFASSLDKVAGPVGIALIARSPQPQLQQSTNQGHRQGRGVFFFPAASLLSETNWR